MKPYVDLHAHFLPGLDDGAKTQEMGLRMVAALASLGFGVLHATPHQRAGMFMPSRDAIDEALAAIKRDAAAPNPDLTIHLAAENFWDEVFHERLSDGSLLGYPGGKAFLFELPTQQLPPRLESTLFEIRLAGRLPVMAHPERYLSIQQDVTRAEPLSRCTALLIDLGALDGAQGRSTMKTARRLLEEGLVHAATSDIHTAEDQRTVAAGMAWIRKRLGEPMLDRLLADHPRAILQGEIP